MRCRKGVALGAVCGLVAIALVVLITQCGKLFDRSAVEVVRAADVRRHAVVGRDHYIYSFDTVDFTPRAYIHCPGHYFDAVNRTPDGGILIAVRSRRVVYCLDGDCSLRIKRKTPYPLYSALVGERVVALFQNAMAREQGRLGAYAGFLRWPDLSDLGQKFVPGGLIVNGGRACYAEGNIYIKGYDLEANWVSVVRFSERSLDSLHFRIPLDAASGQYANIGILGDTIVAMPFEKPCPLVARDMKGRSAPQVVHQLSNLRPEFAEWANLLYPQHDRDYMYALYAGDSDGPTRTTVWAKYRRSDMELVEKRVVESGVATWHGSDDYQVWGRFYVISGKVYGQPMLSVVFVDWRTGEVVHRTQVPTKCGCYG